MRLKLPAIRESLDLVHVGGNIMASVAEDNKLSEMWRTYQKKYPYAMDISYKDVIKSVEDLYKLVV